MNDRIWLAADSLVDNARLVIDRPKGSTHPRRVDVQYPLDYGYLEGTVGGDQAAVDVWVGSLPGRTVTALICTIDLEKADAEVKLLISCKLEEEETILAYHNAGSQSAAILRRNSA